MGGALTSLGGRVGGRGNGQDVMEAVVKMAGGAGGGS